MEGTKLLLRDAIKDLDRHLNSHIESIDGYLALATHFISQITFWGNEWLRKLESHNRTVALLEATNNNTHTIIVTEAPVTFRKNYDGGIEILGIPDVDSREVVAVKADCQAYLDEMKQQAEETKAADSVLERGQRNGIF